jgi:hypothetical protein
MTRAVVHDSKSRTSDRDRLTCDERDICPP